MRFHRNLVTLSVFLCVSFWAGQTARASCQPVNLRLALNPGGQPDVTISGSICVAASSNNTVQVLVHGATYGRNYWDFPFQPEIYSYVRFLNAIGMSSFNFDRLGSGQSSHPQSDAVTLDSNAFIIHQIVQGLRDGTIGGHRFQKVVLVGHSFGSVISIAEAARYHDVDGVVLTSLLHRFDPTPFQVYPAAQDPRFAGAGLDPGYLTTIPGTRGQVFYYQPTADPRVIQLDESTKETLTGAEFNTVIGEVISGVLARQINVPILLLVGRRDRLFCVPGASDCSSSATILAAEAPFYTSAPSLQAVVVPSTGHDLTLHYTSLATLGAKAAWVLQTFGF